MTALIFLSPLFVYALFEGKNLRLILIQRLIRLYAFTAKFVRKTCHYFSAESRDDLSAFGWSKKARTGSLLFQTSDDLAKDIQRMINLFFGVIAAQRKANRAASDFVGNIHRAQHAGNLFRLRVAGRARRNANARFVQLRHNVRSINGGERNIRGIQQALRTIFDSIDVSFWKPREDFILQMISQRANPFVTGKLSGELASASDSHNVRHGFGA